MKRNDQEQITLRLPAWLHQRLKATAKERGYSVNELILFLLQSDEYIEEEQTQSPY